MAKRRASKDYLAELERQLKGRGVRVAYERLSYAGLMLKSGLCWFRGDYYLFIDRLKSPSERRDLLEAALDELDELAAQNRLDRPGDEPGEQIEPA